MRRALVVGVLALAVSVPFVPQGVHAGGARHAHLQLLPSGRPVPFMVHVFQRGHTTQGTGRSLPAQGCPRVRRAKGRPANVRVSQDCGFVQAAEEWVDVNPKDPRNLWP